MDSLFIKNGRIIDPGQGIDRLGSLLIAQGDVAWLGESELPPDYDVLDATGMVICPGFIDLHCHLRQPGFEAKETIATGTAAAARGGFTTVCCMPNTEPPLDNSETINYVKAVAAKEASVRVLPIGCVSTGRAGQELADLEGMAAAGVVGFSDDGSAVADSRLMRQALERACNLGLPIIDHCEDMSLSRGGQINEGEVSARLGLQAIPAAAEEIIVARDLLLAELTGGHLHIAHASTSGSVELIRRAREKGVHVTAEVTPHHLTLTEAAVLSHGSSAKVNPPLRTEKDVQALVQALRDGVIDIIATDHAPHTGADKQDLVRAAFGISGLETALGSLMALVHAGQLTLTTLIARLTSGPARIIGNRSNSGSLSPGAPADITIFDPNKEWVVDPATFASKGRNTPLAGSTLRGKVMASIAQGKMVYKDSSIRLEKRLRERV